ncbi:MAG: Hsp20/alpha crystallin family protein [Gemmatimonadaceae bacterium]|nr:Hsp20/alpha crystallin family protein [Gemmatimonadaceae bacterium]
MFSSDFNSVLDRLMTVSQAMDDAGSRAPAAFSEGRARTQLWLPPVDIYETESAFVVEADLPGVHRENVDIQFDRNTLMISGTRAATLPSREKLGQLRVFSSERLSGGFSRSVRLPEHVDAERIEATFTDGVLSVTVPKSSQAVPRKIAIGSRNDPKSING